MCGRLRAYQFGATDGFSEYTVGHYINGVSLTRGGTGRRQHIWTFAAGLNEVNNNMYLIFKCPCDIT